MTGINCRGCNHDQNDHKQNNVAAPGSKSPVYQFKCLVRGCACQLDGSPSDDKIRPSGNRPSHIILPGTLQQQLQAQLSQQAEVGLQGIPSDDFRLTDPETLLNAPVGGPKIEDEE